MSWTLLASGCCQDEVQCGINLGPSPLLEHYPLAHLYKLRDKDSGGYLWGQSLVFLVLVTPKISIPVGFTFYQPAPERSAWYRQEKVLKKQGVPKQQRPPKPAPHPLYPTKQQLALRLLERFKGHHPGLRVHCIVADALYGTAPF